jgi:hypothetical protein
MTLTKAGEPGLERLECRGVLIADSTLLSDDER